MAHKVLKNLQLGFGFSMLVLISSALAMYISLQRQRANKEVVDQTNANITAAQLVLIDLQNAETGQRGFLLTGQDKFLEPFQISKISLPKHIDDLLHSDLKSVQAQEVEKLAIFATRRMAILEDLIKDRKILQQPSQDMLDEGKKLMDSCRTIIHNIRVDQEERLEVQSQKLDYASWLTSLLIGIASFASLIITSLFFWKLRSDYSQRIKLQEQLVAKEKEMKMRLNLIRGIAEKVTKGDFNISIADSEQDDLGNIAQNLLLMTNSLKQSFQKLNQNDWKKNAIAQLNSGLMGNKSLTEICEYSLRFIIQYMKLENGAFYIFKKPSLILKASVGLKDKLPREINTIDGSIGEVLQSKTVKVIKDISPHEFHIKLANGELYIKDVALFPILYQQECIGVLELGSRVNITEEIIDLTQELGENIGVAITDAHSRERVQQLLEETQTQTEELQVQHSELENLNVELEAQTQKLKVSEEELRSQQEELLISNRHLEERSLILEEKNQMIAMRNKEIQEKAEALALSTKYKSEFLANMSHELRTPLNSILLLSRVLSENNEGNLNSEQIESSNVIWSSGNGLLNLIDEILDLSKIEAGKMNLEIQEFEVSTLIDDVKQMFKPLINEKNLKFEVENSLINGFTIYSDRLRVEQILRNLLSNALKFTAEGSIKLKVERVKNEDFVTFEISDTGIGIAADKIEVIFDAFQQADGSTRRKFGGTGLGLSISKELARLLQGELSVQSQLNKGSTFKLRVPITTKQEIPLSEEDKIIQEFSPFAEAKSNNDLLAMEIPEEIPDNRSEIKENDRVILIVEDDTVFAKSLIAFANKAGFKAICVVRGDLALTTALKYQPVAILLDIMLPVMDGWQVLESLKTNVDTRHIPVHMMSAENIKKHDSIINGAINFINKPFDIEDFQDIFTKIDSALNSGPKKVLIVEENTKHASALSYYLESFKISTEIKSTLEDSVQALNSQRVDCVILDMGVPDAVAYDTIEAIKSNSGLEDLPIIVFTGKSLSPQEELKIKQYADSIVLKTAHSYQRILDEVSLFLHLVDKQNGSGYRNSTIPLGSISEILQNRKILIADDDIRNVFSLSKSLEKFNVKVFTAMDGQEAWDKLQENPSIEIILMDIMMPNLDGFEAIKKIRNDPRFKNLPIIAVTAKAMIGDREKCILAGASDYISKPVDPDQLVSLLRVWLFDH